MSAADGRCAECGGGFPGDVPKSQVCTCGSAWARGLPKRRATPLPRGNGLKRGTPLKSTSTLKRGAPMKRGTPLKQTSSLKRTGPIAQTGKPKKKTGPKARVNEIPAAVRVVVLARAGGCCEACGKALGSIPAHLHHRQRRDGRNHTAENLVALHPTCHVLAPEAVHQRVAWARERGLIVRTNQNPAEVPLVMSDGRRVLLGERYILAA